MGKDKRESIWVVHQWREVAEFQCDEGRGQGSSDQRASKGFGNLLL
jgi:hypothetical protein